MKGHPKIALIGGEFSGTTASLAAALQRADCHVVHITPSLRHSRWRLAHVAAMFVESFVRHGSSFRNQVHRTAASNRAYAQALDALLLRQGDLNAVIQVGVNYAPYWRERRGNLVYTAFTDHTNLLSKGLPSFGVSFPEQSVSSAWNEIEERNLMLLDHVFVMGGHVKQSMVRDYGLPGDRVTVVGGGPNVDVDIERDQIAKSYIDKNLLFVGLDAERKGLPLLLTAFENLPPRHASAVLHVVGVEGRDRNNVRYYGRLHGDALKNLFYKAQVFVMPTYREPFGVVFVEAMWAKAVCIGTSIEAIPEIIQDDKTGFLVEPGNAEILSKTIEYCLDHPEVLERMGNDAYRVARARWSWDLVAQSVISEIRRVIRGRNA